MITTYTEWLNTVPSEIINDPIWKLEVYRLALFADDIGWEDVLRLSQEKLMFSIADQLHRSLGSISANMPFVKNKPITIFHHNRQTPPSIH